MKFCFDRHPSSPLRTETSGDISYFILCFEILTTAAPSLYNFFVIVKMMPEVSIYYLMVLFRVFLLIIGQKQNFSVIASTKNGIDMKCHDSLKPLCE